MQLSSSVNKFVTTLHNTFPRAHMLHGIKTGLACLLSYAVTEWLKLDLGYWAVISTVIVMQVYVADSIRMCLYRFTGTAVGALLGAGAILLFPETQIGTGAAIFFTTALCSFMTFYNNRYKMAAITVVIVILASIGAADRISFGTGRFIEIGIGVLCAFIVSVLIFPERMIDVLKKNLDSQKDECIARYHELIDAFLSGQKPVNRDLMAPLTRDTWKNHELFNKIKAHEQVIYKGKIHSNLTTVIATLDLLTDHLRTMTRILNSCSGKGFEIITAEELIRLKESSLNTLRALINNSPNAHELEELKTSVRLVEEKMAELRSKGVTFRFDLRKIVQVYSFCHSMLNLAEDLILAAEQNPGVA